VRNAGRIRRANPPEKVVAGGPSDSTGELLRSDVNGLGGIRLTIKDPDGDAKAELVVGAGTGAETRVTDHLETNISPNGKPPELLGFDAFFELTGEVYVE
jgi:hypothetical protein